MRLRTLTFCALHPLCIMLCASSPPPEGATVRGGAGASTFQYTSGGCGTARYANRAEEGTLHVEGAYRAKNGVTGHVDVGGGVAHTRASRLIDPTTATAGEEPLPYDENELGRTRGVLIGSARLGYHHKYFGVEAGPFVAIDGTDAPAVGPAGNAWVGVEAFHVWGNFLTGPASPARLPLGLGVGHVSEGFRGQLGAIYPGGVMVDGALRVSAEQPLFAGARLEQTFDPDHRVSHGELTLGYTW